MGLADSYRAAGVDLNRITVTEGGSRNELWNRIKSHMLGADVVRFRNAGGAVLTNCIVAAHAVGDAPDVRKVLSDNIERDAEYAPVPALTSRYRTLYDMRQKLVREDMKTAFSRLVAMRTIE